MTTANAREAMNAIDYALGYELMRSLYRVLPVNNPLHGLARYAGVEESEIQRFLDGADPGEAIWEAGESVAGEYEPPDVELEAVALNLLADTFPPEERIEVRRALAEAIAPVLAARGRTVEL